jgi:hypothetical protein
MASTETVIVNSFGDTRQQVVLSPTWRSDYQKYLADFRWKCSCGCVNETYLICRTCKEQKPQ